MARYNQSKTNFSAGLLGSKLRNRTDIDQYNDGCLQFKNFIPTPQGAANYRNGTLFLSTDLSTALSISDVSKSGIYPYVTKDFSGVVAVCFSGGQISLALSLDEANFYSIGVLQNLHGVHYTTGDMFDFSALDARDFHHAQNGDILFLTHPSGDVPMIIVSYNKTTGKVSANYYLDSSSTHPFFPSTMTWTPGVIAGGQNVNMCLATPYSTPNTNVNLCFYFSEDPNPSTAYVKYALPPHTGASLSQLYMYCVDSAGTAVNDFFNAKAEGTFFRITDSNQKESIAYGLQYDPANPNRLSVAAFVGWGSTLVGVGNRSSDWRTSNFSPWSGFCRSVSVYNQRLAFTGNEIDSGYIWFSKVGNPAQFITDYLKQDITTSDVSKFGRWGQSGVPVDDAFGALLGSIGVNRITWLACLDTLIVGTTNAEFSVRPIDGTFSRTNIDIKLISSVGSCNSRAEAANDSVFFISRDGRRLYRLRYSETNGGLSLVDMNSLNDELLSLEAGGYTVDSEMVSDTFIKITWSHSFNSILALTYDGELFYLTNSIGDKTIGWSWQRVGSNTDLIRDICSIPGHTVNVERDYIVGYDTADGYDPHLYCLLRMLKNYEHPFLLNNSKNLGDKPIYFDYALVDSIKFIQTLTFLPIDSSSAGFVLSNYSSYPSGTSTNRPFRSFYYTGMPVRFSSTGTLPPAVNSSTTYYLRNNDPAVSSMFLGNGYRFKVYPTLADALANTNAIDITGGSGIISAIPYGITTKTRFEFNALEWASSSVEALIDGIYYPSITLDASGNYTHTSDAKEIFIGKSYEGIIQTMPIEAGAQSGNSRGNITRIDRVTIGFYNTFAGQFGSDINGLEDIEFDGNSFTGDKTLLFPTSPDRENTVIIKQDTPFPMTVLGITQCGVSNDR